MFLFQEIEEIETLSNDSKSKIAEFVLAEKNNIRQYTISQIAEMTFTSKASVVRFAKALGYEGWKDFLIDFEKELIHQEKHINDVDANFPFTSKDKPKQIVENLLALQTESLNDTAELLDYNILKEATDILIRAKKIVILGRSPHIYCAQLFVRKLLTIGKDAVCCTLGETGLMTQNLTADDCAIIISYSGSSKNNYPMERIPHLKRQNVPIIGITSDGDNYIRKTVDLVFTISTKEKLYSKIANFSTEESVNFILNILFSSCISRNYEKNLEYKVSNAKKLEQERHSIINNIREL